MLSQWVLLACVHPPSTDPPAHSGTFRSLSVSTYQHNEIVTETVSGGLYLRKGGALLQIWGDAALTSKQKHYSCSLMACIDTKCLKLLVVFAWQYVPTQLNMFSSLPWLTCDVKTNPEIQRLSIERHQWEESVEPVPQNQTSSQETDLFLRAGPVTERTS